MLLHDERFSGWSVDDMLSRFHFSKLYLRFCSGFGWDPYLYCFHESVSEKQVYEIDGLGTIKIFPVSFRFPPLIRFGNDHNPAAIMRELERDEPDIVHFHSYYLFSFPYLASTIKRRIRCPLTTQLHGCPRGWRRLPYLPSLMQLRTTDRIFYSYGPEKAVYDRLGVSDKAVRVPMPSIDPEIFKPDQCIKDGSLLYVGRLPGATSAHAEKSPVSLLFVLRKLLQTDDVRLKIVGDGVGESYCRRQASDLGVEGNVEFKGFVPRSEIPELYRRASLTLVPLKLEDIDGFFDGGIQESLACGTPVAAFKSIDSVPLEGTFGFRLSNNYGRAASEVSALLDHPDTMDEVARRGASFVRNNCTEARLKDILGSEWGGLLKR
jgi:glycosyltransferase involved in cell wall biosynthesis